MAKVYNVMYPRKYWVTPQTGGKPEERTEFIRVGSAFPLKDKDGFSLDIGVPLTLSGEGARLLLFAREERDEQAPPTGGGNRNQGGGGGRR